VTNRFTIAAAVLAVTGTLAATLRAEAAPETLRQSASDGWQVPDDAVGLQSPLQLTEETMTRGREIYRSKCQRCHGRTGTGNGPDADRDRPPGNLTDARRAARNPDGVMFYKIWNGRSRPRMPAFKTDISRDDVWAVVHYVKSLRRS
jgi:mono/diheme cytochrome c family protein